MDYMNNVWNLGGFAIMYYSSLGHLKNLYDEKGRAYAFKANNTDEYVIWKAALRARLKAITGLSDMQSCDLQAKVVESKALEGYKREKVVIHTEPDVLMPLYVLIPDGIADGEKRPAVIAAHGHGGAGKESVAGVVDKPEVAERIRLYNGAYGLELVKQGYVVFCPDARGSGERRELKQQGDEQEKLFSSSCVDLSFAAISLGQSLLGMWIWDLMRLVDFIETLDYCDHQAIACCGFSGGGLQSLWLAAMDDRISAAVISGYFHGYRDTVLKTNMCGCNFVPYLWETADIGDIAALVAPRPLLIESGRNDPLNGERGLADVLEQLQITKLAYKLFGKEESLYHYVFDGGHEWNGAKTGEFFRKYLRPCPNHNGSG